MCTYVSIRLDILLQAKPKKWNHCKVGLLLLALHPVMHLVPVSLGGWKANFACLRRQYRYSTEQTIAIRGRV